MGSFKTPREFDSLDLEILERAYEAVWAEIVTRNPESVDRHCGSGYSRRSSLASQMPRPFATKSW
jgi:hypothetical protein